jgi:RNA polymerase sporulation-specific sigma factor
MSRTVDAGERESLGIGMEETAHRLQPDSELLVRARTGDPEASAQLLEENAGLVWSIVRRYYGRGLDSDDLYQLGCMGFLKAIRGFDPAFGTQFSTYAVPKIAGEIRRFLRDDGPVKVSRSVKDTAWRIMRARDELEGELGRSPLISELAARTGMSREEIAACESAVAAPTSLQSPVGGDDDTLTLESVLGGDGIEDGITESLSLRTAVAALPDRERQVIVLRYHRGWTQERTAKVIGVSQVQVSRIEKRAVERLRAALTGG